MSQELYDIEVTGIDGQTYTLDRYRGKVLLVVNVASKWGFTPQYAGLATLHEELSEKGLAVLGFPCNQFAGQEPDPEVEIQSFCTLNFGVKFPMHAKIDVNGASAHPLYNYLKAQAPGLLGSKAIKWNFTKFLVDREGKVRERFAPAKKPEQLRPAIEALLG